MADRIPLPEHLDRWTVELRATGDTRDEALNALARRIEAMRMCPDEYTDGACGDRTRWRITEDPDGLTGEERQDAIRAWMRARREADDG